MWLEENEVDPRLVMKSRVAYKWKPLDGGASHKAKARIVIQGYRDPHLPLLTRDAPVLADKFSPDRPVGVLLPGLSVERRLQVRLLARFFLRMTNAPRPPT